MRRLIALIAPAFAFAAAGCATAPQGAGLSPSEAVQAMRIERRIAGASNRIQNPKLDAHLTRLLATIDQDPRPPITLYVVDDPTPQADLLANRILRLRLSLLLALRNDDELLFVLAHELAHRDLGHISARRRADWDPAAAEREADRMAVAVLRGLGRRDGSGVDLLQRLAEGTSDDDYRRVLTERIDSLRRIVGDATPAPAIEWPLAAVLEPYRDRTSH